MDRRFIAPLAVFVLALAIAPSCGTGFTLGEGFVVVDGLAPGQVLLCGGQNGAQTVLISGSGFLSEHGDEVDITWTAVQGTPFNGSATAMTTGTVISESVVDAEIPDLSGIAQVTITVTLPGTNFGTSPPQTIEVGGELVGPFPRGDGPLVVTGNVTYPVIPGTGYNVLLNDQPAECGSEEMGEKPGDAGGPHYAGVLTVVNPPMGFEDDATPGVLKQTNATPASGERGTVIIQADGTFVYEPPLGYEGSDDFYYWMEDDARPGESRRARVTLNVSKVVWFVRDTAAGVDEAVVGTGRYSDPFDSLISFNSVQNAPAYQPFSFPPLAAIPPNPDNAPQEGDCIFIYDNVITTEYDEGIRLRDSQQLIGEGVGLFLNDTQIVAPGTAPNPNPVLTNTGLGVILEVAPILPVVTLGNGNTVRGIDIDEDAQDNGYGDGIYGFDVSGPTFIDQVNIRNAGLHGIHLQGFGFEQDLSLQGSAQPILGGVYQIGDPQGQNAPCVTINNSGIHGIFIEGGEGGITQFATAAQNGLTVNVVATDIIQSGSNGIEANDCNLDLNFVTIEDAFTGVNYTNNQFGQVCTLSVLNSNIGLQVLDPDPVQFNAIRVNPFGDVQAYVGFTYAVSNETALVAGLPFTAGALEIAVEENNFLTQATDGGSFPTVHIRGFGTTVTSLDSNRVEALTNSNAGGMLFEDCHFDANPATMAADEVPGGDTIMGLGGVPIIRILDTALRLESCSGALTFDTLEIYQESGNPAGFTNTGTLVLDTGVLTVDHQP